MLTPQALDRASSTYRRGYRAGYSAQKVENTATVGSFGHHDFEAGYEAGWNDAAWANHRTAKKAA